jgi:sugar lactone lactonase YvrE
MLAESIVWDDRDGALLWCDIAAGTLHRGALDAPDDGSQDDVLRLEPPLASFFPTDTEGYVVSLGDRIVTTDAAGRIDRILAVVPHAHDGLRLNEGKVDPVGRWVTGSMDATKGDPDGALYSIAPGGELRTLRGGFGTTNGIDWTPDGASIYFTDTATETIYRGSYTPDGDILDEQAFASFGPHDGLTVDRDGHVWTALYGEGRVLRLDLEGDLVQTVEVPVPNVTSVALVGPGLDVLAIGSARENLDEEQLARHPLSGALFGLDVPVPGVAPHRFGQQTRK